MSRYVVSIISPINLEKSHRYLTSVSRLTTCTPVTILVGFSDQQVIEFTTKYPHISFRTLPSSDLYPDYKLGYGAFLDAFPDSKSSDLFIVADTNSVIQRDIPNFEWDNIKIYATNKYIMIETSYLEGSFLPQILRKAKAANVFSSFITPTIEYKDFYFIVARKYVFKQIREVYEHLYRHVGNQIMLKYRYSILMSYIIKTLRLKYRNINSRFYNKPELDVTVFNTIGTVVYQYSDIVIFATDLLKTPPKVTIVKKDTSESAPSWFRYYGPPITASTPEIVTYPYASPLPFDFEPAPLAGCNCQSCIAARGGRDATPNRTTNIF